VIRTHLNKAGVDKWPMPITTSLQPVAGVNSDCYVLNAVCGQDNIYGVPGVDKWPMPINDQPAA
jgi:hypothetical protein